MRWQLQREALLTPLQQVMGATERKQVLPILSHVLFSVTSHQLALIATDLEIQIEAKVTLAEPAETGDIAVPAKKLMDICRALPEEATMTLQLSGSQLSIKAGRSQFKLATLPANEFPRFDQGATQHELMMEQQTLRSLLHKTQFAMAQQDVRHFLNGVLLELTPGQVTAVASDGHRLAAASLDYEQNKAEQNLILPRKCVVELMRLLADDDSMVTLLIADKSIHFTSDNFTFSSKLIEGKYPNYQQVIPEPAEQQATLDGQALKQALSRVVILSDGHVRGVHLRFEAEALHIQAKNDNEERAEETVPMQFAGEPMAVGFNANYLLDVLNVLPVGELSLDIRDAESSCRLLAAADPQSTYVIMPMCL